MRKGVSPLIGFVITVSLISVAVTIVMAVIKPTFDRVSDTNILDESMKNLELLNSVIKQVASESEGSKRTITITVTDGNYRINTTNDYIYMDYETKTDYAQEGIIRNVRFDQSPVFIEYFDHYVNNGAASSWTVKNGTWAVESGEYSGQNGLAYYHYGSVGQFAIDGRITNKSGIKAEMFALPTSPTNLMGYWTFDEGTGTNVWDYSGYNNTGTLTIGPIYASGQFDYGLNFDGSNDYANVLGSESLRPPTTATFSAWVKSAVSISSGSAQGDIIDYRGTSGSDRYGYVFGFSAGSDGKLFLASGKGTGGNGWNFYKTTKDSWDSNRWYHVSVTVNGSNFQFYIDGIPENSGTAYAFNYDVMNSALGIGGATWGGESINGTIDEVQIFNTSLTAAQVKSLYETSWKKISSTGKSDTISATTDIYLTLATPVGHTHFDEVKIKTNKREMRLSIPYLNVDLNGTARFGKGNYQITVTHKGINTTINEPIVEIMIA